MRSFLDKIVSLFRPKSAQKPISTPQPFLPRLEPDSLSEEKNRIRQDLLDKALSGLDISGTRWDIKRFVAIEIKAFINTANTPDELEEKNIYLGNVLGLINKASDLIDKAIAEDRKRDIKKHLKGSRGYYRMAGLSKVSDRSISDTVGTMRSIRPVLLGVMAEKGVEKFVALLPDAYKECLEDLVYNSTLRRNTLNAFKRENIRIFAPKKVTITADVDEDRFLKPVVLQPERNPEDRHKRDVEILGKLKNDIQILYQAIENEIGAVEIGIADLPDRIALMKAQSVREKDDAEIEKALHLLVRNELQAKIDFLMLENPELASHVLIAEVAAELEKRTRILKPSLSAAPNAKPERLGAELARLKNMGGEEDWFLECNSALKLLVAKVKINDDMAQQAQALEKDVTLQQKRKERYIARRDYAEARLNEVEVFEKDLSANNISSRVVNAYPPLSLFREWYEANPEIRAKVLISEDAIKETESSTFSKPELVYESISLLANEFWAQKNSGDMNEASRKAARAQFRERLEQLRLRVGGSITTSANKYEGAYSATVNGERLFMDQHLQRGNSRDERYCLRVYFAWSDRQNAVVIGHMPSHLRNEMS